MTENSSFQHPHFRHLARLMALEAKAESEQLQQQFLHSSPAAAERTGNSLIQLVMRDEFAGLGGRWLVTLGKRNQQTNLPWTRLRMGSPVQLSEENNAESKPWRGVVSQLRRDTIQVAFTEWPEAENERATFRLDLASDEFTRRRAQAAMALIDNAKGNRLAELRKVLLGEAPPHFQPMPIFNALHPRLNQAQHEAVAHALAAADVAIIHGPPGTGKTTAVVELIRQAVRRGDRVLACAPSNLAVDNIFERLLSAPELNTGATAQIVRIGHPARVLPALRDQTLEMLVENHPDMKLVRKLTKEAHALRAQAAKYTRAKPAPGERRDMRQEAKAMLADARRIEEQLVARIFGTARVVCATLTGLDEQLLGDRQFDLCVIDEAAQSTEPVCWIPLRYSQRLVLAGDHCQLPPTIIAPQAAAEGLAVSMLERLMAPAAAPEISRQLTVQHRMHQQIMDFSSATFYGGTLIAHATVQTHLLCELPGVQSTPLTDSAVHFIDTAGADYQETLEAEGGSRYNAEEANLVQRKVDELLAAGVAATDIAVISPYAAQVRRLREQLAAHLENGLEIGSIDGFQGREQEAVIISLVRSNPDGEIGFLADTRRMNVALTRARRKLIVIGDSATIGGDPFYAALLAYFDQIGAYHTVWEETW
ncbi:MAG: AAA domain-containing protein [Chloroflexi bacterium]|nr:AAA domain-containing protein [Chloroflexota bacterium]